MKSALALPFVLIAAPLALAPSARAQEVGQYAIAVFPPAANQTYSHALIVDTKNGHVWEWVSQGAMGNLPAVKGLFYQGQVIPGKDSKNGTAAPQR